MKSKYHNKSTTVDGIKFASLAEARYYQELKMLKHAHKIKDFTLQPRFLLQEGFRKCPECMAIQEHIPGNQKKQVTHCRECGARTQVIEQIEYVSDFLVYENDGRIRICDVKGTKGYMDPVFKLKYKLFLSRYPDKTIEIVVMPPARKK